MLDSAAIPSGISDDARSAVAEYVERLERAAAAGDLAQVIGTAKDLVECAAKVVLQARGVLYGSRDDVGSLANRALATLGAHPSLYQDRPPVRQLAQTIAAIPPLVTQLRNSDGTGHGRPFVTDLHPATAEFVRHVATAWSTWLLAALDHHLQGLAQFSENVWAIEQGEPFRRGELRRYLLDGLRLVALQADQQRRLGAAVGHRWVRGTVVADSDAVEPLAAGDAGYPSPFATGVIEGLFIDSNGYVRSTAGAGQRVAAIAGRLGLEGAETLVRVAETIEAAELAYAFSDDDREAIIKELREAASQETTASISEPLQRIAASIEALG